MTEEQAHEIRRMYAEKQGVYMAGVFHSKRSHYWVYVWWQGNKRAEIIRDYQPRLVQTGVTS